jgi:arylsulfatase
MKPEDTARNQPFSTEQSRREFLKVLAASSPLLGASVISQNGCGGRENAAVTRRPNIVVILADDMGYSDIGCFGGEIQTPAIDALAAGGLRFTHFHNTARCCPSRASLLTGLYPHQAGVGDMMSDQGVDGYRGDLNRRCVTIAEVLRSAGYGTYGAGKWHVTRHLPPQGPRHNWPLQRGFDRFFGTITGAGSYFEPETLVRDNTPIEPGAGFYYTDAIADQAVEFVQDHGKSRQDQPFFLYCAFTAPHWPLHAPKADIARYKGRFDEGWDILRGERHERMNSMGVTDQKWRLSPRDPRVPAWSEAEDKLWQLRRMEVYAAQVEIMDRGIGRIVSALETAGTLSDTLIIFLSDNGGCHEELTEGWSDFFFSNREKVARMKTLDGRAVRFFNNPETLPGADDTYQSYGRPWANLSNTPFRLFKASAHEGGVATPLVVHWPRSIRQGGEFRRQLSHIIDIMATCVEVSGAQYPAEKNGEVIQPMEGRSLIAAFSGSELEREAIFCEHEGNRAIITPEWKLVARGWKGAWELYDMLADRTETSNLAAGNPRQVALLSDKWNAWANRVRVFPRPGG